MTDTKIDLFTLPLDELKKVVADANFTEALNYYYLLALPIIEEKTKGGIYLSIESKENSSIGNNVGRIVAFGSAVGLQEDFKDCRKLSVGDYVGYNPHAGLPVPYDNSTLICIADQGLRTKIKDITKHTDGIFKTYSVKGVN